MKIEIQASEVENEDDSAIDGIAIKCQAKKEYKAGPKEFKPHILAAVAGISFVVFIVVSVVTFAIVNENLGPDSKDVISWKANFAKGNCGTMDMTNSL